MNSDTDPIYLRSQPIDIPLPNVAFDYKRKGTANQQGTCRSCDVCFICGRYFLRKNANACKWISKNNDSYGIDCDELSCPFCKYCSIQHCSDDKLVKGLEFRNRDHVRSIHDISRQLKKK